MKAAPARPANPLLAAALEYAARGWRVLPLYSVREGGRCDCGAKPDECKPGKHPRTRHGVKDATTDAAMIRGWWARWPTANIGIATGAGSGLVVVDVDGAEGRASLAELEATHGKLGASVKAQAARGPHVYCGHPGGEVRSRAALAGHPGLDVRADGGYVVAPPSRHASGVTYCWASGPDGELAPLPAGWLALLREGASGNGDGNGHRGTAAKAGEPIPAGQRNATLTKLAGAMRRQGSAAPAIEAALDAENATRCDPPLPAAEVHAIAASIARYEPAASEARHPRDFPLSDTGNGELIATLYGDRLRFDHRQGRWLLFGPHYWRQDDTAGIYQIGKEATRARFADALNCAEPKERKAVAGWALGSESRSRIEAALHLARSEAPIADTGDGWDADPYLLGVANGVVNLRTGELRDGQREDRITIAIPLAFDPDARAPRWERFLREVFAKDDTMIAFVARAAGYSLTGDTREQVLFLNHGGGGNGKTTLLRALRETLGPYGADTPFSTLELQARTQIPEDVAALAGKRFVTAAETSNTSRLNEARIKCLTGGDEVTACFKYGHLFTYRPTFKLWLACNRLPRVLDTSRGFWRRVRLIPYTESFDPNDEPTLEATLRAEAPGILAWAVRGALAWQEKGLQPPQAVKDATREYEAASDPLGDFLGECAELAPQARERASHLYRAYAAWAARQRLPDFERLGTRTFGEELAARYDKEKRSDGAFYLGLRLNGEGVSLADATPEKGSK